VYRTKRVVKARVVGTGINVIGQPELRDSAQPLKIRMLNEVENQVKGNGDEAVNRVVENLMFIERWQWKRFDENPDLKG